MTDNRTIKQLAARLLPSILLLLALGLSLPSQAATGAVKIKLLQLVGDGASPGLRHPSDVALSSNGDIFILDGVNNRVAAYNPKGEYLYSFGRGGKGKGEFDYPLGMAIDSGTNLYIADTGNARIQVLSAKGEPLKEIPLPDSDDGERPDPTDVAVDEGRGILYVVDNDNHRLLLYDLKRGELIRTVGGMSMKENGFRWPFTIHLDASGTVYVVDVINTTVKALLPDEEWRFDTNIGKWGVEWGELYRPKGVAVDKAGNVFISDSFLGSIQIFDRQGRFLSTLHTEEGRVRRFVTPTRLLFDNKGRLYIVEMYSHRVVVLEVIQ